MRAASRKLGRWLGRQNAWALHSFLDADNRCQAMTLEGLGETLLSVDLIFIRDSSTHEHYLIEGPNATDEFIMSEESSHLHHAIFELDIDTELGIFNEMLAQTAAYRI